MENEFSKEEYSFMFISDEGHIIGREDTSRLDALPWYKRLYAKINKSYRDRFVDIKGFKIDEL